YLYRVASGIDRGSDHLGAASCLCAKLKPLVAEKDTGKNGFRPSQVSIQQLVIEEEYRIQNPEFRMLFLGDSSYHLILDL
ncbi:MAG: hypothetical protein ACYTXC_25500, partial [Nostoc sp.]